MPALASGKEDGLGMGMSIVTGAAKELEMLEMTKTDVFYRQRPYKWPSKVRPTE
jgi:hypothetical protein